MLDYLNEQDVDDLQLNTAHRVIINKVDDKGDQQLVDYKGLAGEEHTEVLRIQPFGLSTNPPPGSEGLVVGLASRDMPVVLGAEHPDHRPKDLKPGATRIYDKSGAHVDLDSEGKITVKNGKATVTIDKEGNLSAEGVSFKFKGPFTIEGEMTFKGNINHTGDMVTSGTHTDGVGKHA
jgi:phage baseplate assembly protein V